MGAGAKEHTINVRVGVCVCVRVCVCVCVCVFVCVRQLAVDFGDSYAPLN